jgi:cytochrome c
MKIIKIALAASTFSLLLATQSVQADEALARSNGCLACHGVENKILGPGFTEVAAKYKDDAGALEMLSAKVKSGGSGTWGPIPMPSNAHVSDESIGKIVGWILSL